MCKKLMFLISFVSVLVLASSGLAADFEWVGNSPYSVLWADPLNWDPVLPYGPDDCSDYAEIPLAGADPVIITAVTVNEIRGPAYGAAGDQELLLVEDANLFVCDEWSVRDTKPYNAYITLQDRAVVYVDGRFEPSWDEGANTVVSMSGDTEFATDGDFRIGDDDPDYFELHMTDNAYLSINDEFRQNDGRFHITMSGNALLEADSLRFRNRSDDVSCTVDLSENAKIEVLDNNFRFSGGSAILTITVADNASIIASDEFRGGEDNDFDSEYTVNMIGGPNSLIYCGENLNLIDDDDADGFAQVNLHGGVLNCAGVSSETDNWNIDICGGTLIIRDNSDWTGDIEAWVDDGHITLCGGGECGAPGALAIVFDANEETTTVWVDVIGGAYDPDPPCDEECGGEDEADVPTDQCLSWTAGECGQGCTQTHFVYLSTNQEKVCNGDLSTIVAILDAEVTTYCPGELTLGATYWWRVDEAYDCEQPTVEGQCWCFTVEECMIVEDMESYDESCSGNAVWEVWLDGAGDCNGIGGNGTGSSLYISTEAHGGDQAMEYVYDSSGSERECAYSLATKAYSPALNLVDNYEKAMVLWFYGDADNDSESMWVVLSDGTTDAQSIYGIVGTDNPEDIKIEDWRDWNIDMEDQFSTVDMSNVEGVSIGFGPRGLCDGEHPGAPTGAVLFDDISLCATICVPRYAPDGDINDDCVVDWDDVGDMGDDWLTDER
ncbi:MAG: hypothetical protein ACYSWR_03655 [Planctomycetota bacterium]|jgi:hypothetical protein